LKERIRNYQEKGQEIDFWLIANPAFLDTPAFADIKKKTPQPQRQLFLSTNSLLLG